MADDRGRAERAVVEQVMLAHLNLATRLLVIVTQELAGLAQGVRESAEIRDREGLRNRVADVKGAVGRLVLWIEEYERPGKGGRG